MAEQTNGQEQTAQISGTVKIQPQDEPKHETRTDDTAPEAPEKKGRKRTIAIIVVLLLVTVAGIFYWRSTFTEDTDDAQVDGDLYQVSSRVTGQVVQVYVKDNQQVHKGDLLAEIDSADYKVALQQAEAQLANAKASHEQATANVPIVSVNVRTQTSTTGSDVQSAAAGVSQAQKQVGAAQARVEQAQANSTKADLDVQRYTPLVQRDVISKQQFDAAVAAAAAQKAAVLEAQAQLVGQQEAVRQAQQKLAQAQSSASEAVKNGPQQVRVQEARATAADADVKQAQAKVDQAKLNLSYCRIVAPETGIVNKKNVQVGMNLSIGQNLLTIIPLENLWVTANFKETQLEQMHPGQEVIVKVDALGGRKFHGKLTQIGGATGSKLSLFPPENATGNYVKVVQRIPVRIDFTNLKEENKDLLLRPGYSVVPDVEVK